MTDKITGLPVEVTQADRDAAANIWQDFVARPGECIVERALRRGDMDDSPLIERLARHRLTPRQDGLREAATFLLWAYDQKQPVADAHEAWKALRAALSPDDGEGK